MNGAELFPPDTFRARRLILVVLEIEEAQQRIISFIQPLSAEMISPTHAARRVMAQDVLAPISLPPFDNSAMDGYAVRAADVAGASVDSPVTLPCVGAVAAGSSFSDTLPPNTCIRIFTGSPLPAGADAVVMQEDTRVAGQLIEMIDAVKPWENVRLAGDDVKSGTIIAQSGERLNAAQLALLCAVGVPNIQAVKQPVIGILSTGNELIAPGQPLAPGQIYESNRSMLATLVAQAGGIVRVFPFVRDSLEMTRAALEKAFAECDAIVSTGGVSVGEHDTVKAAFEGIGGTLEFWKVAMKPGKPFAFGHLGKKLLFGLPGNPVSAFVTFLLLVRPAILKLQGVGDVSLPAHPGVLAEPLQNRGPRRHFMRVSVDAMGKVRSAGLQASHALSSLARANALVNVPPETLWPSGAPVTVLRWEF